MRTSLIFTAFWLIITFNLSKAQHSISGFITNENGEALEFVVVFLEGTTLATYSNSKGYYELHNIPSGSYNIKLTYVGLNPVRKEINILSDVRLDFEMTGSLYAVNTIEIYGNRVNQNSIFTNSSLSRKEINNENNGVDIPVLMQWTPSLVSTSDSGAGIGYTGLRIRGSDQTRINVTLNGIPVNDAESHNVFWVNMPDLSSSVQEIQIQRGVGASTLGAGAFGATVGLYTHDIRINPYINITGGLGSFNSSRLNVALGSGLIKNKYNFSGRVSQLKSDGYIDRSSSKLNGLQFSAARLTDKSSMRFNIIDGKEVTYQSWFGVPEARVVGDLPRLNIHYINNLGSIYKTKGDSINLFSSDRRYNFYTYPKQNDNYRQTHYQSINSFLLNPNIILKASVYYTRGKGYYEEQRHFDDLDFYNLPPLLDQNEDTLYTTDLIRRRWLDNHLVGSILDAEHQVNNMLILQYGLAGNTYIGHHFGQVISVEKAKNFNRPFEYYRNRGDKQDYSTYIRGKYSLDKMRFELDLQGRQVIYKANGIDNGNGTINVNTTYLFFNPKIGLNYLQSENNNYYFSFSKSNKEPSRNDFIDNGTEYFPKHESLINLETGYRLSSKKIKLNTNVYYMKYLNQLVLTGEINDVGAPIRINVPNSYRLGLESELLYQPSERIGIAFNLAVSKNKIRVFDEVLIDYTEDFEKINIEHRNRDISFSPNSVGAIRCFFAINKDVNLEWSTKYVGAQYLDNTQNKQRRLSSYHYHNLVFTYKLPQWLWQHADIQMNINNITNRLFSSNGYTYSYIYETQVTENFLFPQAGINGWINLRIGF